MKKDFKYWFCKLAKITTPIVLASVAMFNIAWLAGVWTIVVIAWYLFDSIK
jgi:hypothetical protein